MNKILKFMLETFFGWGIAYMLIKLVKYFVEQAKTVSIYQLSMFVFIIIIIISPSIQYLLSGKETKEKLAKKTEKNYLNTFFVIRLSTTSSFLCCNIWKWLPKVFFNAFGFALPTPLIMVIYILLVVIVIGGSFFLIILSDDLPNLFYKKRE